MNRVEVTEKLQVLGKILIILGIYRFISSIGLLIFIRRQRSKFFDVDFDEFKQHMIEPINAAYQNMLMGKLVVYLGWILIVLYLYNHINKIHNDVELSYDRKKSGKYFLIAISILIISLIWEAYTNFTYISYIQQLPNNEDFQEAFMDLTKQRERRIFIVGILFFIAHVSLLYAYFILQDFLVIINTKLKNNTFSKALEKFDFVKGGAGLLLIGGLIAIVPTNGVDWVFLSRGIYFLMECILVFGLISSGMIMVNIGSD